MDNNLEVLASIDTNRRVSVIAGKSTVANMSVDAGSSGTRVHMWSKPTEGNVYAIDSTYSIVQKDISHVGSASTSLYDNLEITLKDVTEGKVDKVFDEIHIVKGGLFKDLGGRSPRTASNVGKGLQDTTYINTISALGIRAYIYANEYGGCPQEWIDDLTLALPQEDVASKKRQEDIKARLAGEYVFTLNRLGFSINITIRNEKILIMDEAQAALGYWRMANRVKPDEYHGVMLIDAGGRSVDLSTLIEGRFRHDGFATCRTGGQNFIKHIISEFVNRTGETMPTDAMITNALADGKLQDGNTKIDICADIANAKQIVCNTIIDDIESLLDKMELTLNQFNLILCTGRMMGVTVNDENEVASLAQYIQSAVKKQSPNTNIGLIEEEFALVKGLSMARHVFNNKNK